MIVELVSRLLFPGLFALFLLTLEIGRRLRLLQLAYRPERVDDSRFGVVQGAVFGLMGLLLALAFNSAEARFDARRQMNLEEANAVGSAYQLLDLLPDSARRPLQTQLRAYTEARIAWHRAVPDWAATRRISATTDSLQALIWSAAVRESQAASSPLAGLLLLPALNEAFDIGNLRVTSTRVNMPLLILWALVLVALVCGVLGGYSLSDRGPRNWLHWLTFSLVGALVLGVILDFEFPGAGRITLARYDEVMVRAVEAMK